jgi:transposase
MTPRRYELTDFEWSIIQPLLPNKRIHPAGAAGAERRGRTGGQRFWSAMSSLRLSMPRMVKPSVARSSVS